MPKEYQNEQGRTIVEDDNGRKMPKQAYEQKNKQKPSSQRERVQTELQVQANLQMADDTWERLIRSLERLESVTDNERPEQSAKRTNFHKHRNEMPESIYDAELEVHLQINAFWHVVAPVRGDKNTVGWLLKDFICWTGGRERVNPNPGKVDYFVIPVIKCILGEKPLNLPELQEPSTSSISEQEVGSAVEQLGAGLTEGDKIISDFAQNPDKKASQHEHIRATLEEGKTRLEKIAAGKSQKQEEWLKRFLRDYNFIFESEE